MSEDILKEFLVESYENLDHLDRDLVDLEQDPRNAETLASVFRTIHTIKGTCGFLALGKLESISHVGESLLAKLRDGTLLLNAEITTALLSLVDAIRQILASIESSGSEGDVDYTALVAELKRLNEPGGAAAPAAVAAATPRWRSRRLLWRPRRSPRTRATARSASRPPAWTFPSVARRNGLRARSVAAARSAVAARSAARWAACRTAPCGWTSACSTS